MTWKCIFDSGDTSRLNVIEVLGLSAPMNKIGRPTYLSKNVESLIVAAAEN